MKKFASALCALGLGFVVATAVQAGPAEDAIAERLKPIGKVCVEGDDSCGGAAVAVASGPARSGEEVYNTKCMACHSTGVAGAPKFGTADWKPRADKGLDTLVANAISGINAMPPRGTCGDCSDDEIKNSVQYMLDGSL